MSWLCRDALLSSSIGTGPVGGVAFTVAVPSQGNISLVVSRGLSVNNTLSSRTEKRCTQEEQNVVDKLKGESKSLQKVLNSQIDFSKRVSRGFQIVQDRVKDRQKSLMWSQQAHQDSTHFVSTLQIVNNKSVVKEF